MSIEHVKRESWLYILIDDLDHIWRVSSNKKVTQIHSNSQDVGIRL